MRWNAPLYDSLPIRLRGGFDRVPMGPKSPHALAYPKGYLDRFAAKFPPKPTALVPFSPSVTMPEPMAGSTDNIDLMGSLSSAVSRRSRRRGLSVGLGTF